METPQRYSLRPTLGSVLHSFFVHHNPFYLLSALCMLAGCYALNGGLDTHSGDLGRVLLLVGTLNFYEALLIGLGLYLIRSRGLLRDGRTLLLLEAVFLVDLTFLNAEMAQVSFRAGLLINALVFALALLKVAIVARVLSSRWPRPALLFIAAELAVLFALPSVFKRLDHGGTLTPAHFYAAWWAAGMLPVLFEAQRRLATRATQAPEGAAANAALPAEPPIWTGIRRVYMLLLFLSLVAHLGMLHWVYQVHFHAGNVAPILLGIATLLARVRPATPERRAYATLAQIALPAAAVWMTLLAPPPLELHLSGQAHLTPELLVTGGAYLVCVYAFLLPYAFYLIAAGAAALAAILFGPSPSQIATGAMADAQRTLSTAVRLVPRTALQWGMVAMAGAFAFLGIGAAVSLRRHPREPVPPPVADV